LYLNNKGLALLNSTAESEERKRESDRAIRNETIFYNFISLSIANLFSEGNRKDLLTN
jgi:hypothetical protein